VEGQGGDNRTYQVACEILSLGLSIDGAFELLRDEWNPHCRPHWSDDELHTKIENAATYAQNEPGAYAIPSAQQMFAAVAQFAEQRMPDPKRSKFCPLFPRDMRSLPDPSWLVANLFPAHAVAVLYGPTGTFKTFTALDIGVAIAAGIPIWGRTVAQGAVAYCAGESPLGIARKRLPALMQHRAIADPDAVPFALVPAVPLVSTPSDVEALIAALQGTGLRFALIVIDTVARALGGLDENSAKDVGLLRAAMEQLRDTFDCSVLLIHHTGKDESRGARGSSALIADLDAAFESKADPEVLAVTLRCEKQRDADPFAPIRLKGTRAHGSIVFDLIRETEYAALTRSNTSTHNSDVGQALKALGAINGKTVTTHVLAMEMTGPDAPAEAIEAKKRALQRCAKDRLRAYVEQLSQGSGHATLWTMPELSEGGSQ
jgi:RecA-family ATPase